MRELTLKQEKFCQEYLKCGDASAAYRASYNATNMKPHSVNNKASELLARVDITARVNELKLERLERTKIDADYVLNRLVQIDEMDIIDILDEDGKPLPISKWPKTWRRTISGMDVQELMSGDTLAIIKKIKWPDKVKNLELIGKHIDVQAFKEQKEISGGVTVTNLIKEISAKNSEARRMLPSHSDK
jgi:phage terminase small subunit